jgi:hypothetical protein
MDRTVHFVPCAVEILTETLSIMSGRYCIHCQRRKRVGDCDRISTHCCNRYKVQSASKSALLLRDTTLLCIYRLGY